MSTSQQLMDTFNRMLERYGQQRWWPAETRFEVMVGAVLTQAVAWSNVEKAIANLKAAGVKPDTATLSELTDLIGKLQSSVAALEATLDGGHAKSMMAEAKHACNTILPAMLEVREHGDALEGVVADDLWPLPTYQEMLFIR